MDFRFNQRTGETYEVSDLTLKRDVGTIMLRSGRISFLPPVLGQVTVGVFTGEGEFTLTPLVEFEKNYLKLVTEKETVSEQFDRLVIAFTDKTYEEIKKDRQIGGADPRAKEVLREFRNRMRRNTEEPRSLLEALFSGEDVENLEAMLLSYLHNPKRPPTFNAFIIGRKHSDLRFQLRPYGALPQVLSPEEVALVNNDPQGKEEGIWYLTHTQDEWKAGTASSGEDKRLIDAENYRIETVISGEKLTATCELTFTALVDGERVLRFGLLPTLRVTKVTSGDKEIGFIQEKKKEDSAFRK